MESINKDILIVDDSEMWRNKIEEILGFENYSYLKIGTYSDAINALQNVKFKLAILDIRLKEGQTDNVDGLQILDYIDKNDLDTKVIIISGNAEEKDRIFALKSKKLVDFIRREEIDILKLRSNVKFVVHNSDDKHPNNYGILVIDDDLSWQNKIEEIFRGYNLTFFKSQTIVYSKDILLKNEISLIILDLCLHGDELTLDDRLFWDFLSRVYPDIPRIAISGKSLSPDSIWGLTKSGFIEFVFKKSVDIQIFRDKVFKSLELSEVSIENSRSSSSIEEIIDITENKEIEFLRDMLSQGEIDIALNSLLHYAKENGKNLNQLIVLSSQRNWIKKQKRLGTVNPEKERIFTNRLISSLLEIIDELGKDK